MGSDGVLVDIPFKAVIGLEPFAQGHSMGRVAGVAAKTDPRRVVARRIKMLDRGENLGFSFTTSIGNFIAAIYAALVSLPDSRQFNL